MKIIAVRGLVLGKKLNNLFQKVETKSWQLSVWFGVLGLVFFSVFLGYWMILSYEKLFLHNAEMNTETWCSFMQMKYTYTVQHIYVKLYPLIKYWKYCTKALKIYCKIKYPIQQQKHNRTKQTQIIFQSYFLKWVCSSILMCYPLS